jgi:hypothetical protein
MVTQALVTDVTIQPVALSQPLLEFFDHVTLCGLSRCQKRGDVVPEHQLVPRNTEARAKKERPSAHRPECTDNYMQRSAATDHLSRPDRVWTSFTRWYPSIPSDCRAPLLNGIMVRLLFLNSNSRIVAVQPLNHQAPHQQKSVRRLSQNQAQCQDAQA